MFRITLRRASSITACCALLVLALPAGAQIDTAPATHVPTHQVAPANQPPNCINVDIPNNTGQTVNDLHFLMDGVTRVTWFYNGGMNPFGPPMFHGVAPDGNYEVHFAGADVQPGDIVHYGVCTDSNVNNFVGRTGNGKFYLPYQWTDCGEPVPFAPVPLPGHVWNSASRRLTLLNALAADALVADARMVVVADAVDLDALRADELEGFPWEPLSIDGRIIPGSQEGGAGSLTTEALALGAGQVVVIHVDIVPADDPGAEPIRITSQFRAD